MSNEKTVELLKLVQENPDLPIVPMVWGEICADDCRYWQGSFGKAEVNEYINLNERFYTKDEQDEIEDDMSDSLWDEYPDMSDDEFFRMIHTKAEALPWKKAIIVYIELPEV